nr:MAG TPA: hypothetical protein [Caudoviricetes sp.]
MHPPGLSQWVHFLHKNKMGRVGTKNKKMNDTMML